MDFEELFKKSTPATRKFLSKNQSEIEKNFPQPLIREDPLLFFLTEKPGEFSPEEIRQIQEDLNVYFNPYGVEISTSMGEYEIFLFKRKE